MCVAVMLSVLLLLVPAMAGYAASKVIAENTGVSDSHCIPYAEITRIIMSNPDLKALFAGKDPSKSHLGKGKVTQVQEFNGRALAQITETTLSDPQVTALYEELVKRGFVLTKEEVRAVKITAAFENETFAKNEEIATTTVMFPLIDDRGKTATISFVSNKFGTGAAALFIEDKTPTVMVYDGGKGRMVVPLFNLKCWVCEQVVRMICNWPQVVSCYIMCGSLCLVFIEMPPAMAICNLICNPICRYVTYTPQSCYDANRTCRNLGYCP